MHVLCRAMHLPCPAVHQVLPCIHHATPCARCSACALGVEDHRLLLCDHYDRCRRAYHTYCLTPPLAAVPEGDWYCPGCSAAAVAAAAAPAAAPAAAAPAATGTLATAATAAPAVAVAVAVAARPAVAAAPPARPMHRAALHASAALVAWSREKIDLKLGAGAFAHGWRVAEAYPGAAAKSNWKYAAPTGHVFTSARHALDFQSERGGCFGYEITS